MAVGEDMAAEADMVVAETVPGRTPPKRTVRASDNVDARLPDSFRAYSGESLVSSQQKVNL
jgi:hypothetical protein